MRWFSKKNKCDARAKRPFGCGKFDITLFFAIVALMSFGVMMVYSASSYSAEKTYGDAKFFMYKQLFGVILGVAAMTAMSLFDYHKLIKLRYVVLAVSFLLLVLVFVPGIGVENYGAKRWIKFPFFTLQSSEIAKFGFVIFSAAYLAKHHDKIHKFVYLLPVLGVGGAMCLLIMLEPNMSVTMCLALVMMIMLFTGGTRKKHFAFLALPLAAAVPELIIAEPYRMKRMTAFLHPWDNPLEEGYQLIQSLYAIGSGGFLGVGLFNSRQKYLFLPFAESDFIFSVIGEETGFIGCVTVIAVYILIISRLMSIAKKASDREGCLLSGGIAAVIAVQTLINVAVVTGSIPPTGVPLPFVSSGSSSIIAFCCAVGIALNVGRQSADYRKF